jgi:hypothetical protein
MTSIRSAIPDHSDFLVGLPRASTRISVWVVAGLGGLAIAGLGALLLGSAWDGYIASNPSFRGDVVKPPPASAAIGAEASVALAMIVFGYLIALIASFVRLRRTRGGWMLLRALAALTPIPICWLWLRHYFTFLVNNLCGDCSPPQPFIAAEPIQPATSWRHRSWRQDAPECGSASPFPIPNYQ